MEDHIAELHEQGFTLLHDVLDDAEVETLRTGVETAFEAPDDGYGPIIRVKMFERGEAFEDLIDRSPAVDIAETVLGDNCHVIAMNALNTPPGTGIDEWHADEEVIVPLPDEVELDPRVQMPVLLFTCMYYLVDVEPDMGPTQLVPRSHRSGCQPPDEDPPMYKGAEPVSIHAEAGDVLIFNGQTWHRGARNESERNRIVQQVVYGKRWIAQRFHPFVNYTLPEEVIDRASPRRRRLLGMHERGPYG